MNWLKSFVLPKFGVGGTQRDVPEDMWTSCPSCGHVVFKRDLVENLHVCPQCDHHMRMPVMRRIESLFKPQAWEEILLPEVKDDPLQFRDSKRYSDRLRASRRKTGRQDALVAVEGTLLKTKTVAAVMDFAFMGGSMGQAVGEGIVKVVDYARHAQLPMVMLCASGGARMQEGMLSLLQMPRTTVALRRLAEARLPYITVLTDPTTGGVSASFAMLGDITLAEPGAIIGFAGRRVIAETIREHLPEGFQRAESLRDKGMVDAVVHRHQLQETLDKLLRLLMRHHG